jgi:hypothetical protein
MYFCLVRLTLTAVIAATGMAWMEAATNIAADASVLARLARTVLTAPDVTAILHDPAALWRIGYLYLCYASVGSAGMVLPWLRNGGVESTYEPAPGKEFPVGKMTGLRGPEVAI